MMAKSAKSAKRAKAAKTASIDGDALGLGTRTGSKRAWYGWDTVGIIIIIIIIITIII